MRMFRRLIYGVCIGLCAPGLLYAKGWHGIEPLQSSKSDVTSQLGSPTKQMVPETYFYDLNDEAVFIKFSKGPCEENGPDGWKVMPGTVVGILVVPKTKRPVKQSGMGDAKYKKRGDEHWSGHTFYSHVEGGEIIETYNGVLISVAYRPDKSYGSLRCFGSAEEWMNAVGIGCVLPVKFDEFGDLTLKDEDPRWDNFALQLQSNPLMTAYVVVYAKRGRSNEARTRVIRAKKYLFNKWGIKDWRIFTVNAETSEDLRFELWVWPLGELGPYV